MKQPVIMGTYFNLILPRNGTVVAHLPLATPAHFPLAGITAAAVR